MKSFEKSLTALLITEVILFFVPFLVFVPVIGNFFPEGFMEVGWAFSLMAIFALIPTFIVSCIVVFLSRKNNSKVVESEVPETEQDDDSKIIKKVLFFFTFAAGAYFVYWLLF